MSEFSEDALRGDIVNHSSDTDYVWPKEPAVRERLEWFQDQKLGFMVHWGIYSQLGITESWPLSREDAPWSRKGYDWEEDDELFRQQYTDLNRTSSMPSAVTALPLHRIFPSLTGTALTTGLRTVTCPLRTGAIPRTIPGSGRNCGTSSLTLPGNR